MILRHLNIISYRNLRDLTLSFSDSVNCFVGNNGMGKTNILDAIYHLSFCKSSINSQDSLNVRHGDDFFMLDGRYFDKQTEVEEHVVCALKRGQRKHIKRNDKEYRRLTEHVGLIPLVLICPNDSQIVTGAPDERRRFMDAVISQYDAVYLEHYIRYQQAIAQRNTLLKTEEEPDWQYMSILEEMLSASASYIYIARANFVKNFKPIFQNIYLNLCNSQYEVPDMRYESHADRGELLPLLQNWREKERIVGYTLHGPHKDNLVLLLNDHELKREGSQGQTKTFFISMKLAQYVFLKQKMAERECNTSISQSFPILLLDDIFDKLDSGRVAKIVEYVSNEKFGQIFITDTNREHLDQILTASAKNYKLFTVADGTVNYINE